MTKTTITNITNDKTTITNITNDKNYNYKYNKWQKLQLQI